MMEQALILLGLFSKQPMEDIYLPDQLITLGMVVLMLI